MAALTLSLLVLTSSNLLPTLCQAEETTTTTVNFQQSLIPLYNKPGYYEVTFKPVLTSSGSSTTTRVLDHVDLHFYTNARPKQSNLGMNFNYNSAAESPVTYTAPVQVNEGEQLYYRFVYSLDGQESASEWFGFGSLQYEHGVVPSGGSDDKYTYTLYFKPHSSLSVSLVEAHLIVDNQPFQSHIMTRRQSKSLQDRSSPTTSSSNSFSFTPSPISSTTTSLNILNTNPLEAGSSEADFVLEGIVLKSPSRLTYFFTYVTEPKVVSTELFHYHTTSTASIPLNNNDHQSPSSLETQINKPSVDHDEAQDSGLTSFQRAHGGDFVHTVSLDSRWRAQVKFQPRPLHRDVAFVDVHLFIAGGRNSMKLDYRMTRAGTCLLSVDLPSFSSSFFFFFMVARIG